MTRHTFCLAVLAATTLTSAIWAAPVTNQVEKPLRLELDLVDGSHIVGTPTITSVPVQTSYSKMEIPLKQIRTLQLGKDRETVTLCLQNGDNLTGVMTLGPIKLQTAFGLVSIGMEHVQTFGVVLTGEAPTEGLIAWYNFNDGTASDASAHKNHGTLRGAKPAPDKDNRAGRAMSFDGKSDWIEVPSSRAYDALAEITIAAWVCPVDDQRPGRSSHFFITKQPSGSLTQDHSPTASNHGGQFDLDLMVNDGLWQVYVCSQVADYMCSEGHTFPLKSVKSGQWHHLAVTISREENRVRVYLDGQKTGDLVYTEQSQTGPILSQPTTEPLRIGKRKDADFDPGSNNYFNGSLDEIRIYNRALKDDEVKRVYGAN